LRRPPNAGITNMDMGRLRFQIPTSTTLPQCIEDESRILFGMGISAHVVHSTDQCDLVMRAGATGNASTEARAHSVQSDCGQPMLWQGVWRAHRRGGEGCISMDHGALADKTCGKERRRKDVDDGGV